MRNSFTVGNPGQPLAESRLFDAGQAKGLIPFPFSSPYAEMAIRD